MKVFVTGALGFIGRALLERYRAAGAEVGGVDRIAEPDLGVVAGDVVDPSPWQDRLDGCDLVFHTAAVVSNVASEEAFWRVNVLGTRRLLEAAAAAGVGRFVHLSSVAAYGFDFPDGVDETHPLRPNGNHYVDTKVASEQVVLQAHAAAEIACSIVRPADVYGPGSRPWTVLPVEMIRAGRFLLPERGEGIFSPVYVDNLIDGLEAVGSREEASGQVFILGDGVGVSTHEFFGHYTRMLGSGPIRTLPTPLATAGAALFGTALKALGRETEVSRETMRMLARRGTYSIAKARRLLGYEPKVDLPEGMQRTERWLADRGTNLPDPPPKPGRRPAPEGETKMEELSTTILNDAGQEYVPLALPEAVGVFIKVLKADEENRRVVAKVKFEANSKLPRHTHHCRALAYTISGEWEYDNGRFTPGTVAYEAVGENHQPFSKTGTEMLLVFDADGDRWLDNHLSDGTTIHMGMPLFKAFEGISLEDAKKLDLMKLIDVVAPEAD